MISDDAKAKLRAMQQASDEFYRAAVKIGVHAFIEHAGLMNEHIKVLERLAAAGVDITFVNVHCGGVPTDSQMQSYHGAYLGEKFACIFSPVMTPEGWKEFVKTVGREVGGAGDDEA